MNIELLRAAYPTGALCIRGVSTLGGFTCVGLVKEGAASGWHFGRVGSNLKGHAYCIVKENDTATCIRGLAGMVGDSEDDLLPDLTDYATWCLALKDLASAHGWPNDEAVLYWHLEWIAGLHCPDRGPLYGPYHEDAWTLGRLITVNHEYNFGKVRTIYVGCYPTEGAYTEDPVIALLLARAQLRKA